MGDAELVDPITIKDVIAWGPCHRYCYRDDERYPSAGLIRAGLGGKDSVSVMDVFGLHISGPDKIWLLVRPQVLSVGEAIVLRQLLIRNRIRRRYIGIGQCPIDLEVWGAQVVSPSGYAFDKANPAVQTIQGIWDNWCAQDGNNYRECILRADGDSFRLALGCMGSLYGIHEVEEVLDTLRGVIRLRPAIMAAAVKGRAK